jgi:uncharacterized protein with von Willebrand factor type A (vWA) domain
MLLPTAKSCLRTYGSDYRVIFVGDAAMSPYEIIAPGGSVEHWNEEPGQVWLTRVLNHFHKVAWLNPMPEAYWSAHPFDGADPAICLRTGCFR